MSASQTRNVTLAMWGTAILWLALNLTLGFSGFIADHPAVNRAFVLGAPIIFAVVFFASRRVREWALGLDTRTLVAAQTARVAGIAFLAVYAVGKLDASFALWAGLLDCAVGFSAIFAASYLTPVETRRQRNLLIAWIAVGVLDFLVAIPLAAMARLRDAASVIALTKPPLSIIAAFFVPLALIDYFILTAKIWRINEERARSFQGDLGARNRKDNQASPIVAARRI